MNVPNAITLLRIALVPVFALLMQWDASVSGVFRMAALAVFLVAASTDWMDGYLARKRNQITAFGKFMDPLADKLLVSAALLYFVGEGSMAAWVALVVIGREFIVSSLRMVASAAGTVIAAGFSGKVKTLVQILMIAAVLTPVYTNSLGGSAIRVCDVASWVMLAVTVWSGVDYLWQYRRILSQTMR